MREVFIVFRSGKHFFQRYLRKGFGHITIIKRDNYNWFAFEPLTDFLEIEILPFAAENMEPIRRCLNMGNAVLKVTCSGKDRAMFSWNCFHMINCVSITKYILGVKNCCLTPYALYKWLISTKCKQIIKVEKL